MYEKLSDSEVGSDLAFGLQNSKADHPPSQGIDDAISFAPIKANHSVAIILPNPFTKPKFAESTRWAQRLKVSLSFNF
jgi:hypothetical protein